MTSDSEMDSAGAQQQPWIELARLAELQQSEQLEEFVSGLSTSEQALAMSRLDDQETETLLRTLDADDAAELISHLTEAQAAKAIGVLDAGSAAAIVRELPSDEKADVLGDLDPEKAEAIIDWLPADEAEAVRELSAYPDDVAGGLMVSELLRFTADMSVADVIEFLSLQQQEIGDQQIRYGYVCDHAGKLIGVLPMGNLLFVKRSRRVRDVMRSDPLFVNDTATLEELIEFFDSHRFLGVPVLDSTGALKGVVHREAVDYAAARAIEAGYLKSQGIVGGEELRTMPVRLRSGRRLSWLSINIVLNVGAASVIALFQDTLQQVIALAVFLPIISDMSGCSGNQAVAVSMRELSLGLIRPTEMLRVWLQEVSVGLINGSVLGLLVGVVAVFFDGNPYLGLVVGMALFANTVIAVSIGGTIPLLVKRLGFDPAVASGPLLTTVTDMCGFFLVLGMATMMLSRLV